MSAGATLALARAVRGIRYEEIPADALGVARHCLLDFLGCGLAGSREPLTGILLESVARSEDGGAAALIGRRERTTRLAAALVNGAAGHALDFDDTHTVMSGHPLSAHVRRRSTFLRWGLASPWTPAASPRKTDENRHGTVQRYAATSWRNGSFPHATGETPRRQKPGAAGWPLARYGPIAWLLSTCRDRRPSCVRGVTPPVSRGTQAPSRGTSSRDGRGLRGDGR